MQARREEGAYPQRSATKEQRSLRRKGPLGTSSYLRLGPLSTGRIRLFFLIVRRNHNTTAARAVP